MLKDSFYSRVGGEPLILDGIRARDSFMEKMKEAITKSGKKPVLAIIQIGNLSASNAYIAKKKMFAQDIGAEVRHIQFKEDVGEDEVIEEIKKLNVDNSVQGIIVQLPIPVSLSRKKIIDTIIQTKDVDGLTSDNERKRLAGESSFFVPATARGVLSLLRFYNVSIKDKKVTVIGRSELVGKPIALLLAGEGSSVSVCHKGTPNIPSITKVADILISAAGVPHLVTKDFVSKGQVVVDVGINSVEGEKLEEEVPKRRVVGDVDFEGVKGIVGAISPVPGGVGPMTVLSLFQNLLDATGIEYNGVL